jgi:hypothetical protein
MSKNEETARAKETIYKIVEEELQRREHSRKIKNVNDFKTVFSDVEKVVINGKTVIVWLNNGNIGKATCSSMDIEDSEIGFAVAYMKAKFGGKKNYLRVVNFFESRMIWHKDSRKLSTKKKTNSKKIRKSNISAQEIIASPQGPKDELVVKPAKSKKKTVKTSRGPRGPYKKKTEAAITPVIAKETKKRGRPKGSTNKKMVVNA